MTRTSSESEQGNRLSLLKTTSFRERTATESGRLRRLQSIYKTIMRWSADSKLVRRKTAAVNPTAELSVIGEALGPRTARLSGVYYFDREGRIGATGRFLDEILRPLGYTVYPPWDVKVPSGTVVAHQICWTLN